MDPIRFFYHPVPPLPASSSAPDQFLSAVVTMAVANLQAETAAQRQKADALFAEAEAVAGSTLKETEEIKSLKGEIQELKAEMDELSKEEDDLKLQEEYALLQKYLQLSAVVKERDSEREAFLLNKENMVRTCVVAAFATKTPHH